MAKGMMAEYVCPVCFACWCNTPAAGRPPKFCGPSCARADKTARQRERRKARREGKPVKASTAGYWGPSASLDHDGPTGAVEDFLGALDGAYLIDGDTSWTRRDPDHMTYPGLNKGDDEGRTVWPPLKVIGSDRPWSECA
jgi:hypothetical protein